MQSTISPVDGSVCVSRALATDDEVANIIQKSQAAFTQWKLRPVEERVKLVEAMVEAFVSKKVDIGREITMQMGRYLCNL